MSRSKLRSESDDGPSSGAQVGELEEIREILLHPDRVRLDRLDRRISDPKLRSSDVGEVFVEALQLRDAKDQGVTSVLAPRIEAGLRATVRRNPKILVDILFPIIGPMIRKAIAESFRRLLDSFNQGIEHRFTLRGLRWRWEAWRSGRPFAEVVLLHTLEFRVEQVFLIHSESGLLIDHAALEAVAAENPDLVSGMFTALRDFVKDSFRVDESGSLGELQVGDLRIWAESAPHTTLAAVIRGTPSGELKELLQDTSERIHRHLGAELAAFDGDQSLSAETQPYLQDCLLQKTIPAQTPVFAWSLISAVLFVLLVLIGYLVVNNALEHRKFERYLEALKREPGIVITEAVRRGGKYQVRGLRDRLAVEPETVALASGVAPADLDAAWTSFFSTDDAVVERRVRTILQVPDAIRATVSQGRLSLAGSADPDWIARAQGLIPMVPGVESVDTSGLSTLQSRWFLELKASAESMRIFFEPGVSTVGDSEIPKLQSLAETLKQMLAGAYPKEDVRVEVLGMADSTGDSAFNRRLSQERAESVRLHLIALGADGDRLFAIGQGEGGRVFSARRVALQIVVSNPSRTEPE